MTSRRATSSIKAPSKTLPKNGVPHTPTRPAGQRERNKDRHRTEQRQRHRRRKHEKEHPRRGESVLLPPLQEVEGEERRPNTDERVEAPQPPQPRPAPAGEDAPVEPRPDQPLGRETERCDGQIESEERGQKGPR